MGTQIGIGIQESEHHGTLPLIEEKKPVDIVEYKKWLKNKFNVEIGRKIENHFDLVALKVCADFEKSDLWRDILANIKKSNEEYLLKTQYPLFNNPDEHPELLTKSFDSFLLKTFRKNIIQNQNWPTLPSQKNEWISPSNWLIEANDIVRTCFVVKYLDGVEFLIEKLEKMASAHAVNTWKYYVAEADGYYAAHIYFKQIFEIPRIDFDTEKVPITIELQITTQLQEIIRKHLHVHFENRRKMIPLPKIDWQWDYKSDEFATNYLGHILHYVEGMIMDVRTREIIRKKGA